MLLMVRELSRSRPLKSAASTKALAAFLFWVANLTILQTAAASVVNSSVESRLIELSTNSTWLRLIHAPHAAIGKSEINTPQFFLSDPFDPQAELLATYNYFASPLSSNPDNHCTYPARFLWLSRHFEFKRSLSSCTNLNRWLKPDSFKGISLLLVSGYFGNPASTFGHALIKVNNQGYESRLGLLDLGINYGALVPENELTPVYIFRGLFGGYEAGFSDKHYYLQDRVYSRTESRDMWEYKLSLSNYEQELLVYHLWEIVGKKYQYYFLKENCAYRLAELIELAIDMDFTDSTKLWYAPIDLFFDIKDVEYKTGRKILTAEKYIPSAQQRLYSQLDSLTPSELADVKRYIRDQSSLNSSIEELAQLGVSSLDALLMYYQYRLANEDDYADKRLKKIKNEVLQARLTLDEISQKLPSVEKSSPINFERPSKIEVGLLSHSSGEYASLSYAAYANDVVGYNVLGGSSLAVFDAAAVFDSNSAYLQYLHLVRASKNNVHKLNIPGESRVSWDLAIGAHQQSLTCLDCLTGFASFSMGEAFPMFWGSTINAQLGALYEVDTQHLTLFPKIGIVYNQNTRHALDLNLSPTFGSDENSQPEIQLNYRFTFNSRYQLRLSAASYFDTSDHAQLKLSTQYRF